MSFEKEFLDCMSQTVVVNAFGSLDGYSRAGFSTAGTTYAALIQAEQKLVRALDGTEQVAETTVHINSTSAISPDSKITLSNGDTRPILAVETLSDDEGVHHAVIHLGSRLG